MSCPLRADSEFDLKRRIYDSLMAQSKGHRNDEVLAQIIASWVGGNSVLPQWLGLEEGDFFALCSFHFPQAPLYLPAFKPSLHVKKFPEQDDLLVLLMEHRAGRYIGELWLADIMVASCMGSDHLWEDLGVWSRPQLTSLLQRNFPSLANKNTDDMKWKKFLYKQLCEKHGSYVCRAPSCEACVDYGDCFGPED